MSESPNPTGLPEESSSGQQPNRVNAAGSAQPDSGKPPLMDEELAREVEAAMASMDSSEMSELNVATPSSAGPGSEPTAGGRCQGRVAGIYEDDVFVEFGGKAQAVVPRSQFGKEEILQIGAEVEVFIERFDDDSGLLIASRDGAIREAHWDSLEVGQVVEGRVTGMNKGGLELNLNGIRGFMPASQVDVGHVKDISVFLGQLVRAEVMEMDRRGRNLLLSRRKAVIQEQAQAKETLLTELAEGQIRKGVVGNLTDFGAFVNLGGVDGLIHISDLSYGQVAKVGDVVHSGQTVEVKVLKIDRQRDRISLGLKQVQPDPWQGVADKYQVGSQLTTRVLRVEKFGAFVELEEGVEGLIPVSEMSWGRVNRPSDVVQVGQTVQASIIRVEPEKRRLALSIKQVEADPWAQVVEGFPQNAIVKGKVTKCAEFGAFVELVPGVEGLVHISELSDQRVRKCEDVVQPGQEVEVRVLNVDSDHRRISLSIKATKEPVGAELQHDEAPRTPKKKRKRPLRGGLTSHFEWLGDSIGSQPGE